MLHLKTLVSDWCEVSVWHGSGELAKQKAEHEKEKKAHINHGKVHLQQGEAVDRYPQ